MTNLTGKDGIATASHFRGSVDFIRNRAYASLTQMAKPFGKRLDHWLSLKSSKAYLEACKNNPSVSGHPFFTDGSNPVTMSTVGSDSGRARDKSGQFEAKQDVYAHPIIAIEFARWLDPGFAVWCNVQIMNLLTYGEVNLHHTEWTPEQIEKGQGLSREDIKDLYG